MCCHGADVIAYTFSEADTRYGSTRVRDAGVRERAGRTHEQCDRGVLGLL